MVAFADLIILSVKDIVAKDMGKKVILKLTCLQMALSDMCIAVNRQIIRFFGEKVFKLYTFVLVILLANERKFFQLPNT